MSMMLLAIGTRIAYAADLTVNTTSDVSVTVATTRFVYLPIVLKN